MQKVELQLKVKRLKHKFAKIYNDKRLLRIPGDLSREVIKLADEMLTLKNAEDNIYIDSEYKTHIITKMHPVHFQNAQKKMYKQGKYIPPKFRKIKLK